MSPTKHGSDLSRSRTPRCARSAVTDLFAVQKHITEKMRQVLDDPGYGEVALPPRRAGRASRFQDLACATAAHVEHASGKLRARAERQAPLHRCAIDARSAWDVFDDVPDLKKEMTAHIFRSMQEATDVPLEQSLAKLDEQYGRAYYNRSYRGAYLGRPLALYSREIADLYGPPLRSDFIATELDAIYPQQLSQDLERLRSLEEEKATLQGLKEGFLTVSGGTIRHRGKDLKRGDLTHAMDEVQGEIDRAREAVQVHDRRCRSVHFAAAAQLGSGWDAYLKGLVAILHYAEHSRGEPARRARRSLQHRVDRDRGWPRFIRRAARTAECLRRSAQRPSTYI